MAIAAFCVWLGVRIVNRRERWAKRTLAGIVLGLPLLYVVSFGPACWWFHTIGWGGTGGYEQIRIAPKFYWPIGWTAKHSPMPIQHAIIWYARGGGEYIYIPINSAGHIDGHSS
jgi:hypothetical protein